jgi:predicted DNA binding CopG/RHH family protein
MKKTNKPAGVTPRQTRYGKLKRAPDWRTTEERIEMIKEHAKKLGITQTKFIEDSIDFYVAHLTTGCTRTETAQPS